MPRNRHANWFALVFFLLLPGLAAARDHAPEATLPPPGECLRVLREGNRRFMEGIRQVRDSSRDLRGKLAEKGQSPLAAVVACSDSREAVEYIFDQPLGGLFIIRTAGNTGGTQTLGSAQYAVHHLRVPLVIVMGHTQCGAVQAAVSGAKEEGALADLLAPLIAIARRPEMAKGGDAQHAVCLANIQATMASLENSDPALRRRIADGTTKLVGALYDIASGEVIWLDDTKAE